MGSKRVREELARVRKKKSKDEIESLRCFKYNLKPARMHMLGGLVPLLAVQYIVLLLQILLSFTFLMIFLVLNCRLKPLFLTLPALEIGVSVVVLYDPFTFVTKLYKRLKIGMSVLYFAQNFAFALFEPHLIDEKYHGQSLSNYIIIVRMLFDAISCYFVWSFQLRKHAILKVVPITDEQQRYLDRLEKEAKKTQEGQEFGNMSYAGIQSLKAERNFIRQEQKVLSKFKELEAEEKEAEWDWDNENAEEIQKALEANWIRNVKMGKMGRMKQKVQGYEIQELCDRGIIR